MRVTYRNGIFVAIARIEENESLKTAGFLWHPGFHECKYGPASCSACKAGLKKGWWTRRHESAARLSPYADDFASKALAKHMRAVEMSRATDAEVEIPAPKGLEYLGFQKAGIYYMSKREGTLLGDEQGLGKTIEIIGLINLDKTIKNTLIICPASLRINWKREAQRWLVPDGRQWLIHIVDEDKAVSERANMVIVHYNRVTIGYKKCQGKCGGKRREPLRCPRCKGTGQGARPPILCDMCKGNKTIFCPKCNGRGRIAATNIKVVESLTKRNWDLVVADEAHFLKNLEAKRTKAVLGDRFKKKPGLADLGQKRIFLTGTPIPNRPIEIWPIISALAPDEFGSFKQFARRYCEGHEEFVSKTKKVFKFDGASNLEELQERLRSTVMIRRLKIDVLKELPPKRRQIISLPPSDEAKELIAEELDTWERKFGDDLALIKETMAMAEENHDDATYSAAVNKLQYIQRVAFVEMAAMRKKVAVIKIPSVISHLTSLFDEGVGKIICFAHHKEVIQRLYRKFEDKAVVAYGETDQKMRQKAVDTFQDPNSRAKLFIGGITAMGVGITLTASSNVVFAELDWTPGTVNQAEDRAHRLGQEGSVLVQHLVLDGSLDARMVQMIVEKQEIADRALDKSTNVAVKGVLLARPEVEPEPVPLWKKIALKDAMVTLAQRRDPGIEGSHGFSQFDSAIGQKLATKSKEFSDKEGNLAPKLATKYRRQLSEKTLVRLEIPLPDEKPKKKRVRPPMKIRDPIAEENALSLLGRLNA